MPKTIDVHDLPEEDVRLVQEMIKLLRKRKGIRTVPKRAGKKKVVFGAWPLGVKGTLTREEIYDHL